LSKELSAHQVEAIKESAGHVSVSAMATAIGCSERTVQRYIDDMQLPPYRPQRRNWTRTQRLMYDAAGLWED
jgi:hypothetical protein